MQGRTKTLLSPAMLIAGATAALAERRELRGSESGESRRVGRHGDQAGVAFIHRVGFAAHLDHDRGGSAWPLPEAASTMELASRAFFLGLLRDRAAPGDIALRWGRGMRAFVEASIVVELQREPFSWEHEPRDLAIECRVLEANGSPHGRIVTFSPGNGDRFIRWVEADPMSRGQFQGDYADPLLAGRAVRRKAA